MLDFKGLIGVVAAAGLLAGCQTCPVQKAENAAPDQLNESPLIVDGAMQIREWDRSTAYYASGDTIAGPTLFRYEPNPNLSYWQYQLLEVPLFVTQVVGIPIMMVKTPIWNEYRYTGVTVEPTHHAMPVLPGPTNVVIDAPVEAVPTEEPIVEPANPAS